MPTKTDVGFVGLRERERERKNVGLYSNTAKRLFVDRVSDRERWIVHSYIGRESGGRAGFVTKPYDDYKVQIL